MNKLFLATTVGALCCFNALYGQAPTSSISKLSGIQRVSVPASATRLIGVNIVRPVLAAGILDAEGTNTLTDNQGTFTTSLSGQTNLWVEITTGTYRGIASLITSYTQTVLTTEDNLTAFMAPGDKFEVRAAHTISGLFGATNSAGLKPSPDATGSGSPDLIRIPNGSGGFREIYYSTSAAGWREIGNANNAAGVPIYHVDGLYIVRNGTTALNLTFAGLVRASPTFFGLATGTTNVLNTVYPTASTLGNSGLSSQVLQGTETTADIISIPNSSGTLVNYYYASGAGWRQVGDATTDRSSVAFATGFTLLRRGATGNLKMIPSTIYNGL